MTRATLKEIERLVKRINELTDSPQEPFTIVNGKTSGNKGCYHIEQAYGGIKLIRMCEGTGTQDISRDGFGTKQQLMSFLNGFLAVLQSGVK